MTTTTVAHGEDASWRATIDDALAEAEKYRQTVGWTSHILYEWSDPALHHYSDDRDSEAAAKASKGYAARACLVGVLLVGARRASARPADVAMVVAACLPSWIAGPGEHSTTICTTWNDTICNGGDDVDTILAAARRTLASQQPQGGKP